MKKVSILFSIGTVFFSTHLSALPNSSNPNTFLGPTAKIGFANGRIDSNVYSLSGEAGNNNIRLDGTLGFAILDNQRVKLTAEYLLQNITYSFFSGNTAQWVQQGALSANYQYDLDEYVYRFSPQFTIDAYVSRAPSKVLRVDMGEYINNEGNLVIFENNKRIAGSNALGISPGFNLHPWQGGSAGIKLHYDDVRYDTVYSSSQNAVGFGGTAHINQMMSDDVELGIAAGVRQPFNHYEAHATWLDVPFYGDWMISALGAYTVGKDKLPSTYNVGISIDYLINRCDTTSLSQRQEALKFLRWGATPAVYMPQVLAISDEQVILIEPL